MWAMARRRVSEILESVTKMFPKQLWPMVHTATIHFLNKERYLVFKVIFVFKEIVAQIGRHRFLAIRKFGDFLVLQYTFYQTI